MVVITRGRGAKGIQQGEARDAADHPAMRRTAPPPRTIQAQMAAVLGGETLIESKRLKLPAGKSRDIIVEKGFAQGPFPSKMWRGQHGAGPARGGASTGRCGE